MNPLDFFVNFFITLFALLDPIGNVPIFAAATAKATPNHRRWLTVYLSVFCAGFMAIFFFTGVSLLKFFGISMDSFKIAGGLLLFLMGLDMTRGDFLSMIEEANALKEPEGAKPAKKQTGRQQAQKSFERLVVPFAMPLLIGPGAISTVIIQAGQAMELGYIGYVAGLGAIAAVSLAVLVTFLLSETISKILGQVGMVVVIRVLGLILCALSVQIIISSISAITHNLILPAAAHPYASATPHP